MVTTLLTLRITGRPKRHLKKKRPFVISHETNPRLNFYLKDTVRQGTYSDKQTTKRSRPFTTLMYRLAIGLTTNSLFLTPVNNLVSGHFGDLKETFMSLGEF